MKTKEALQLVYELAADNLLSKQEARENDLSGERDRQIMALGIFHDMLENFEDFDDEDEPKAPTQPTLAEKVTNSLHRIKWRLQYGR